VLRFLESTGVGFIPGKHEDNGKLVDNPIPPPPHIGDIAEWPPTGPHIVQHWRELRARPAQLRDIVLEGKGKGKDALLGVF